MITVKYMVSIVYNCLAAWYPINIKYGYIYSKNQRIVIDSSVDFGYTGI